MTVLSSNGTVEIDVVKFRVTREEGNPLLIDTPAKAARIARELMPDDAKEHFGVLMLNTKNYLIAYHEVAVGSLDRLIVHPREVFGPALRMLGVSTVVLVHNHPSGDITPSATDFKLTRSLIRAGKIVGVPVNDHVIIGSGTSKHFSFGDYHRTHSRKEVTHDHHSARPRAARSPRS